MSFFNNSFNASIAAAPLVPEGDHYLAEVLAVDEQLRDGGIRSTLHLTFGMFDAETSDRVGTLHQYLQLRGSSKVAIDVSHRQLGQLCLALGIEQLGSAGQLLHGRVLCSVVHRRRTDTGEMQHQLRNLRRIATSDPVEDQPPF